MFQCPKCGQEISIIFKTENGTKELNHKPRTMVRRRRKCAHCGHRFSTVEMEESAETTWVPAVGEERFLEK